MLRVLLLVVLLPTMALADDYDDIDRLCRPGLSNETALQATFEAEGWVAGPSNGADLILALSLVTPFLGDINPSVIAAAPDQAFAALPAAMDAIVAAPVLRGPDNTLLALLPFVSAGGEQQRSYVTCLAVFDGSVSYDDLTARLANIWGDLDEVSMRLAWSNVEGLAGSVLVFGPKPAAFASPLSDYRGGPVLYVKVADRQ